MLTIGLCFQPDNGSDLFLIKMMLGVVTCNKNTLVNNWG